MLEIYTAQLELETKGYCDPVDLTDDIQAIITAQGFTEGQVTAFVYGSTAALTTIEYEPGLVKDLKRFYDQILPEGPDYAHHQTWNDGNGFSHMRASLLKPDLVVPFYEGRMMLGTWQQIIAVEFDNRERKRMISVQIIGKKG